MYVIYVCINYDDLFKKIKFLLLRLSFKLRCRYIKLKEFISIFFRYIVRIYLDIDVLYLKIMSFNIFNICRSRNIR